MILSKLFLVSVTKKLDQLIYTVLLYMPDYMNSSAGIEQLMPWSDFIKEQCSGLIDVESNVPEKRIPLPLAEQRD